jgi:hypothetical protein
MMGGPLTNDQRSKEYYRIAYQCAEIKHTTGCNDKCNVCPLNVHLYVDDVRDATLIKTSAALDYGKATVTAVQLQKINKWNTLGQWIKILLYAGLLFVVVYFPIRCVKGSIKQWAKSDDAVVKERPVLDESDDDITIPQATYRATPAITEQIFTLLIYLNGGLDKAYTYVDLNNDGLYSCIDAAMAFKACYAVDYDKSIKLVWNYNTKWSHLFCMVPNGYGEWLPVECTVIGTTLNQVMLPYVWGKAYDPKYNKDITDKWYVIQNPEYTWHD